MSFFFPELVATYLSSNGVGVFTSDTTFSTGQNIYVDTLPTSPSVCTAVIATGGPYQVSNPTRNITFQVIHRNTSVTSARCMVTLIHTLLNNQWNILCPIVSSTNTLGYTGRVYSLSEPGIHWREDKTNWPCYSTNYMMMTVQQS